ncbi:MAG: hypothetical protein V1681_08490, partial [Candidatus Neomarinimicrobiota bacterium]
NAILNKCEYKDRQLSMILKGIVSQNNETVIISPTKPAGITLNGQPLTDGWTTAKVNVCYRTTIRVSNVTPVMELVVRF